MRWSIASFLGALAAFAIQSRAQSTGVEVSVTLEEKAYLPGEDLIVGVRITNLSGRPLTFGSNASWLNFYVETKDGDVVTRLGQVPVEGEFVLDSAKVGTKWWNIQPHFDLTQPGSYLIYAEVRLPDWNQRLVSEPVKLNVEQTRTLWDISFGVPPSADPTATEPEIRRYSLISATRDKERKLFARVADDSESRIFKVIQLDRLVSFAKPEQQLDHVSRLHVLFQVGGNSYTYCVIQPDGTLVVRERHDIVQNSRPRLAKAEDGSISVRGGRRFPTSEDVPPYVAPTPTPAAPAQAATNSDSNSVVKPTKKSRAERREERRQQREKSANDAF